MADPLQLLVIDLKDSATRINSANTLSDDGTDDQSILRAIKHRVRVFAAYAFIACLSLVLVGMMVGYSSTIGLELNDIYQSDPNHGIKDQSTQASLFGVRNVSGRLCRLCELQYIPRILFPQGFGSLGALLGGPIAWPLSDRLGRKPALMLGGIPTLIGWLMIAFAHFAGTHSDFLVIIQLGRFFTGIGAGWFIFCVSVRAAFIANIWCTFYGK